MKKGKGKVHPSPPPSHGGPGVSGDVLRLLPAAILMLTAALGEKDKEVLAYLIARSMKCHVAQDDEQIAVVSHPPTIGCGCFECYTSFWSRWDSSPDREIIHQAIEGFEEHLASVEKEKKESRKKKRRGKEKVLECSRSEQKVVEESCKESEHEVRVLNENVVEEESEKLVEEEDKNCEEKSVERKKGWADVMGILNFRLWGASSPENE